MLERGGTLEEKNPTGKSPVFLRDHHWRGGGAVDGWQ